MTKQPKAKRGGGETTQPPTARHKRRRLSLRRRTAYHEAGHAVASMAMGRKIRVVTIDPQDGLLGSVTNSRLRRLDPSTIDDRRIRMMVEREVIILLAGRAAESLAGGGPHGGRRESRLARQLVSFLSASPEEESTYVRWLYERAYTLVRLHWEAVDTLAKALLLQRRMSGIEVANVVARVDEVLVPARAIAGAMVERQKQK